MARSKDRAGEPREVRPRIVAELGRPETPEETAARKAENSRKHRANQTPINLLLSLAASLGIVLFLILVVVRPDQAPPAPVDYAAIAQRAQPGTGDQLVAPVLPPGWTANRAQLERSPDESLTWYIGLLIPDSGFIALEQGIGTTAAWLPGYLGSRAQPNDSVQIEGVTWQAYDRRASGDVGNYAYSLYAEVGDSKYLLHGSASDDEFRILASALAAELTNDKE